MASEIPVICGIRNERNLFFTTSISTHIYYIKCRKEWKQCSNELLKPGRNAALQYRETIKCFYYRTEGLSYLNFACYRRRSEHETANLMWF
jgi:hypothetical protein